MSLLDLQYILEAGKEQIIPLTGGRYLRLAKTSLAAGRLRVKSDRGDDVYLTVGRGVFLDPEAKNAYVKNEEANPQTFTLVNGSDNDIDFALSGGLVAIDKTGALDANRFKWSGQFTGATRPAIQIWNDGAAGSGTRLLIESMRVLSVAGGAILADGTGTEYATLAATGRNKYHLSGGIAVPEVQFRREDLAGSPGGSQGITLAAANTWYELLGDPFNPLAIGPQYGFYACINAADTLHVMIEGRRVVV